MFFIEALIKIIALGFVLHKGAYLRDTWNIIDFFIVITSIIEIFASVLSVNAKINLKALRNMRVLRPLKTINAIPSMRRLVATLISSIP